MGVGGGDRERSKGAEARLCVRACARARVCVCVYVCVCVVWCVCVWCTLMGERG